MPSIKEKETMGSYKKFLLNKGKTEGLTNETISKLTKLSIQEVEAILKNTTRQ